MAYWRDHRVFGPSRSMHTPTLRWVKRSLRKSYRKGRGHLKYNRAKWTWWPKHILNRRAPFKTQMRNDHFLRQLDRTVASIRPPHKRRKSKTR